ncbi:MAG TPA: homogentisate 1,2-dioxygenase, partial [Polyangiaceae bacterium]
MIDRHSAGLLPPKPHTVLRDPSGNVLYEEMHTRRGFDGPFTYFYHRYPVTPHTEVAMSHRGFPTPVAEEGGRFPIRRRLYQSDKIAAGGQLLDRRTPVLFNSELAVYFARASESDDAYFANGDADELWFVHEGGGRLESPCGWLEVKAGDYVWVPKAMIHRWHLGASGLRAMIFEATGGVRIPEQFRNPVG